jgi:hypothetical protein
VPSAAASQAAIRRRLYRESANRDQLFEIVERRREALHNYLEWAKANDNEQWTFRMSARPDIRRAAEATARLHLEERNGTLRVAAQLVFTGRDASLYLVPYSIRGEYFYGEQNAGLKVIAEPLPYLLIEHVVMKRRHG